METWEFWYPDAAATGLLVARARIESATHVWLHAAPPTLSVRIRDAAGERLATGSNLERQGDRLPMTLLTRTSDTITREDRWPSESDLGSVVVLPGGEAGILTAWWHADDKREWRWSIEFYNRNRES